MKNPINSFVLWLLKIGSAPEDGEEVRLEKRLIAAGSALVITATSLWGITYLLFHAPVAAAISLYYSLTTIFLLVRFSRTRRAESLILFQLVMGLILPFCDTIALGGFTRSSGVILWSMISALGATFFYKFRIALRWWLGYFALLIISGFLQPYLRGGVDLPAALVITFFVMNIGGVSIIVLLLLNYFKQQKDEAYRLLNLEQQKSEDLLLNVLPKEIAAVLKNEKRTIAENFDEASILFADLVGFTPLSAQLSPVEMVNLLNEIFSYFDRLVEKYDLEKIRTIGDNYMVAAGVPKPRQDHARALACMALEMRDYLAQRPPVGERQVQFRIGINSGSVIGGVIGRKKFVYDIWGDAVNIASRMESQGQPGKIQITQATFDLIQPWFECESRGLISVKGCGEVATYFLAAARPTD